MVLVSKCNQRLWDVQLHSIEPSNNLPNTVLAWPRHSRPSEIVLNQLFSLGIELNDINLNRLAILSFKDVSARLEPDGQSHSFV